jgi:hypothetical protein
MRVIQEQFTVTAAEVAGALPLDEGPEEKVQAMRAALSTTLTVVFLTSSKSSPVWCTFHQQASLFETLLCASTS